MKKFIVTHIDWDLTTDERENRLTPKDVVLQDWDDEVEVWCDDSERIADVLTDEYGWCVSGFDYKEVE